MQGPGVPWGSTRPSCAFLYELSGQDIWENHKGPCHLPRDPRAFLSSLGEGEEETQRQVLSLKQAGLTPSVQMGELRPSEVSGSELGSEPNPGMRLALEREGDPLQPAPCLGH
uniref:Uncharacterized protein n=1 Tax=Mandrillus leucophaeus TaxID=9568 RepID=A0A2K5ZQ25_MANLE